MTMPTSTASETLVGLDGETPIQQVIHNGIPYWLGRIGGHTRLFPQIAGGDGTDGDDPPAGDPPAGEPGGDGEAFDKDRALATIRKLREGERASKAQAKELETLKAQLKAHEDAKLSETDRLKNQVAELEQERTRRDQERQEVTVRYEVRLKAADLGFADPADAVHFLDFSQVEFAEDGTPKNAEALLKKLLEQKPYLKKATGSGSGTGVPASPKGSSVPPTTAEVVEREKQRLLSSGMYRGGF